MYINFTHRFPYRHKGSSGGWENHTPSRNPALDTIILVATFELAQECSAIVWSAGGFSAYLLNQVSSAPISSTSFIYLLQHIISYIIYICPFLDQMQLAHPNGKVESYQIDEDREVYNETHKTSEADLEKYLNDMRNSTGEV